MKIAAIILNYNSSEDCRRCVSFLKRQQGVDLEIILVDNCSSDAAEVEALCKETGCTFLASAENRGYNAGNNIGLRYAAEHGYKYAMITNPDMEFPDPGYISKLLKVFDPDPAIVMVGSDIMHIDGYHQNPIKKNKKFSDHFNWMFYKIKYPSKHVYAVNTDVFTKSCYCSTLAGCCFVIDLEFLQKTGFLDENVFLYCEEEILAEQVRRNGKSMYYVAETAAIHNHVRNVKANREKQLKQWLESRLYYEKNYNSNSKLEYCISFLLLQTRYFLIQIKNFIRHE